MAKRVSTRKIKKNRHYTYETAALVMGLTPQTVRSWRAKGLSVMTGQKPHYILGEALIEFVKLHCPKRTNKMPLHLMNCFGCGEHRKPMGAMVDYLPITDARGRLMGLCEVCGCPMNRLTSKAGLVKFDGLFDIAINGGSQA
ncbi:hypothetical protein [Sedimentitalea sp.]|uniref:hypothetical protein n=1 Tax=Sedimentitalea sp. TaxID=2048915 RepID=UPI003297B597